MYKYTHLYEQYIYLFMYIYTYIIYRILYSYIFICTFYNLYVALGNISNNEKLNSQLYFLFDNHLLSLLRPL